MAIFTDARELEVQAKRRQFRGGKNLFGKFMDSGVGKVLSAPAKFIAPGLYNEMQILGSKGDERDLRKKERGKSWGQTVKNAAMFTPGGPVASIAAGMFADQASGAMGAGGGAADVGAGGSGGGTLGGGSFKDYEAGGGAMSRKQWRQSGKPMDDSGLNPTMDDMQRQADIESQTKALNDYADSADPDNLLSDTLSAADTDMLETMGTEDLSSYTTALDAGDATAVSKAAQGGKGFLGIGKGGKLGQSINKFQTGKFAKGMATAGQIAGVAGAVAESVMFAKGYEDRLKKGRRNLMQQKLSNAGTSYA